MINRKKFGQHLLRDQNILNKIVEVSNITKYDTVFELGTGMGNLTEKLCLYAKKVISVEIDETFFELAKYNLRQYQNLELIQGNGLKINRSFDILVSNIPYSESRNFIEWLAFQEFKHSVVTVQKEFADKLLAQPGLDNYRAISVIAQNTFQIQKLFNINKKVFDPPPKVDSTVLLFKRKKTETMDPKEVNVLKALFSFRRKTISSSLKIILKNDGEQLKNLTEILSQTTLQKRVEQLTVEEVIRITKILVKINIGQ